MNLDRRGALWGRRDARPASWSLGWRTTYPKEYGNMLITDRSAARLAVVTGLSLAHTLVPAATVAAYPATPDDAALSSETVPVQSAASTDPLPAPNVGVAVSTTSAPMPTAEVAPSGPDRDGAIFVAAGASLAALAGIAAAFALSGHRRASAKAN
jgi:hypothetical protein